MIKMEYNTYYKKKSNFNDENKGEKKHFYKRYTNNNF